MFCPKCATQNIEGAKFCRTCGADISLVPQAMAGPPAANQPAGYNADGQPYPAPGYLVHNARRSFDKGLKNVFVGLGFLIVSIVLAFQPMGRWWWYWMLIPAFTTLGGGVVEIMRSRRETNMALPAPAGSARVIPPTPAPPAQFASRSTGELMPQPPSVTEGTTRHLGAEAPTRHIGARPENSGQDVS